MKRQNFNEITEKTITLMNELYKDEGKVVKPSYHIELVECPFTGTLEEMKVYEGI